jgi:hypothetical protein
MDSPVWGSLAEGICGAQVGFWCVGRVLLVGEGLTPICTDDIDLRTGNGRFLLLRLRLGCGMTGKKGS